MKIKDETICYDFLRDGTSTATATAYLQYGVWDKLPTLIDLFNSDDVNHGYAFTGWTTTSGGQADFIDGEWVKNLAEPNMTATLYGTWIQRYYYINYNANGGEIKLSEEGEPDYTATQRIISVDAVTLPTASDVTRAGGWMLDGWSKTPYGLKAYEPGGQYVGMFNDFSVGTLYAVWKPLKYQVRFHSNWPKDIGKTEQIEQQEIEYNIITKLRANTMEFVHWEFTGWATSSNGAILYLDEQRVVNLTEDQAGIDLYARWTQVEFVMTFHKNAPGGSGEPVIPEDPDDPVEPTDRYITGVMEEEVFEINVAKTINLNQYVYPKEITIDGKTYDTKDRGFNGWLVEPGGYDDNDDGHYRIEWVDGEEIILDRDVDVYAFWDDCIYLEYDSTNFKRLKLDFEREYPLLAERGVYKLIDQVHPGSMYRIRDNIFKQLYGCELKAWGSSEGINFLPGNEIPVDLFDAGNHFVMTPLYNKRYEIYNAADKGDIHIWGLDDKKINDEEYLNEQTYFKMFEILPRSDYIEDYLDVNITIKIDYKDVGGAVTVYWLPESNSDCEWEELYKVQSGTSANTYKKTTTVSVPGWYVSSLGRYVYYFAIVMCPYGAKPGKVENWGDPNIPRGWGKSWKKFRHNVTRTVAAAALVTGNPVLLVNSMAFKSTKNAINNYVAKAAKETSKVKIAGHNTGEAIIKAVTSKQCQIAIQVAGVIASLLIANPTLGVQTATQIASWCTAASTACTIVADNTKGSINDIMETAAIGFKIAGYAATAYAKYDAWHKGNIAEAGAQRWKEKYDQDVSHMKYAEMQAELHRQDALAYGDKAVIASVGADASAPPAYQTQQVMTVEKWQDFDEFYRAHYAYKSGADLQMIHGAQAIQRINLDKETAIVCSTIAQNAIQKVFDLSKVMGTARQALSSLGISSDSDNTNGLSDFTNTQIERIYERTSDGKIFVETRGGIVFEADMPGIDWNPINISCAITLDSIIYPADDQGIVEINC